MKKITILLLILSMIMPTASFAYSPFDTLVPQFTAIPTDTENAEEIRGSAKGLDILVNASYVDISDLYNKEEIIRLSALGIVRTYGARRYYPSEPATGYDAIYQLVRLSGGEEAVMARVDALMGSATSEDQFTRLLNQEMLVEAQNTGIVLDTEVVGLLEPVSREQLAVWVARTAGVPNNFDQQTSFAFSDWQSVNPTYRAIIEDLVSQGLMPLKNDGTFDPKGTLTRSELGEISNALLDVQADGLGMASNFGLVVGIKPETLYEDGNTIDRRTITVKNVDGTVTNLISETHTKGNVRVDYSVFKDNLSTSSKSIDLGDELEYITVEGVLHYAEVLDDNKVLERMGAAAEADLYSIYHYGTVSDLRTETRVVNGQSVITEIYRITDVTGNVFDILVNEDTYTGRRDDIITYKDGGIGGVQLLENGDAVQYLVNADNQVVYIKVAPHQNQQISGTIRTVSPIAEDGPATMTIFGYDDRVYTFPLAPYAILTINDRVTGIDNYVYGMPVTVDITNGYLVSARGESYSGEPGYIPPFGKMRMGKVDQIYQTSFWVNLSDDQRELYRVGPNTVFTKDGNIVTADALKTGASVKLYFDNIATDEISKVEIEAPEILFEIIYKGQLKNVNSGRREIQLVGGDGFSKPEFIANNDWTPAEAYTLNLKINDQTEFYAGDQKLTQTELSRKYQNYNVYAVVKSVYGQPTVVKLSVRTGGESTFSSRIRTVDHTLGRFDINTKENFNLTEGTIVIKDGLVVPNSHISPRDTVYVVSESPTGTYNKNAMVVKVVTPFDDIFDRIRIGAVENVNTSSFTLANYTSYTNNFLNAVNPNISGDYKFYTNSRIVDVTDPEEDLVLKASDFWHDAYAKSENVTEGYHPQTQGLQFQRYYAFMVVNPADNSVIAMHMRHKGLLPGQNIDDSLYKEADIAKELEKTYQNAVLSRGIVTGFDHNWDRIELTDSHDWTAYTGQWTANRTNIFVRYTDTIVIKNNAIKTVDDIQPGDYLYIMRIKDNALVIFIES
ncbi:S-layer homology domain-containing protein [Fusibacter tunisiensis]|uniref:SLH domain-containing protein n=1 Tax=Fusibacter tunisiensis TaxID=1008308 RepID=A0ABS2MNG3_9FIRM|nr:S-layer homology domain-containing protein [Fusibacter tunisiensis]MBM7560939.1 hypothetical protein [Fusibacter tunisiensis]